MRIASIDAMRSIALITLMLCHVVIFLTLDNGSYPWIFFTSNHLIGDWGGALFMFIMGASLAYTYAKNKEKKFEEKFLLKNGIERGLFILMMGVILSILSKGFYDIPNFDTLHFVGLSTIFLIVFRNYPAKYFISIMVLVLLLSPLVRQFTDYVSHWGGSFESNEYMNKFVPNIMMETKDEYQGLFTLKDIFLGLTANAYFPIFPWIIFPILGFLFGREIATNKVRKYEKKALILLLSSCSLFIICTFLSYIGVSNDVATGFFPPLSFYPNTTPMIFLQISMVMLVYILTRYLFDFKTGYNNSFFMKYSKTIAKYSFTLYFLQIFILGKIPDVVKIFKTVEVQGESNAILSPPVALICSILGCYFMYVLAKFFDSIDGRFTIEWCMKKILPGKNLMEKMKKDKAILQKQT